VWRLVANFQSGRRKANLVKHTHGPSGTQRFNALPGANSRFRMTAEIIQFIPRPNPNRERQLEALPMAIMNEALDPMREMIPVETSPVYFGWDLATGADVTVYHHPGHWREPDEDSA
jgi:hypothetical protein